MTLVFKGCGLLGWLVSSCPLKKLILGILILYFEWQRKENLRFNFRWHGHMWLSNENHILRAKWKERLRKFYIYFCKLDFYVFSLIALVCLIEMICFIIVYFYFADIVLCEILNRPHVLKNSIYIGQVLLYKRWLEEQILFMTVLKSVH